MKKAILFAVLILAAMALVMTMSMWNDSATFDEVAHIGAGFTYLAERDGRLNPEHPPLIKNIAALPLFFMSASGHINFSVDQPWWSGDNVNDRQWAAGNALLYEFGNNPDTILRASRIPVILLTIFLGWLLFWWTRKNYGTGTALLSLSFFALSPTVLAHGRYVTTDLGAALAFFAIAITFLWFIKEHNALKKILVFGIVVGLGLLVKFSVVIIVPFLFVVGIIYKPQFLLKFVMALAVALAVVWVMYIPQVLNYPPQQNLTDAHSTISNFKVARFAPELDFWLLEHTLTRPLGQYLHGFLMAAQRTAGGNSAYFMGEVSAEGWRTYFPVLAATKEQLGFYALMLIALAHALYKKKSTGGAHDIRTALFLSFVVYYWAWALWSPLTIGVRHILPTFPFLFVLVARGISRWIKSPSTQHIEGLRDQVRALWKTYAAPIPKGLVVGIFLLWMIVEVIAIHPLYLSYYNLLGGGTLNGWNIATDSNYDWGQDLKRLTQWAKENDIKKIHLDYFGGGSPQYYLGDRYQQWQSSYGAPQEGYFAVSLNSLAGAQATSVKGFAQRPEDTYSWLQGHEPFARAGTSILIYKF